MKKQKLFSYIFVRFMYWILIIFRDLLILTLYNSTIRAHLWDWPRSVRLDVGLRIVSTYGPDLESVIFSFHSSKEIQPHIIFNSWRFKACIELKAILVLNSVKGTPFSFGEDEQAVLVGSATLPLSSTFLLFLHQEWQLLPSIYNHYDLLTARNHWVLKRAATGTMYRALAKPRVMNPNNQFAATFHDHQHAYQMVFHMFVQIVMLFPPVTTLISRTKLAIVF